MSSPDRHFDAPAILVGLVDLMPPPGTPLPPGAREKWMAAFGSILDLCYPQECEGKAAPSLPDE